MATDGPDAEHFMASSDSRRARKVRTLFLSDIHLGYKQARVRELNEFLRGIEAGTIVLVGDIVDALSLSKRFFWSAEHTNVVRTLLARQRSGSRLIYVPGNHDASLAMFAEMLQGQLEVHREWVHRTARGQRLLMMHGDQFDGIVSCPALVEKSNGDLQLVRWPHGVQLTHRSETELVADAA
jgi:UDP-2,3-diacylglucosamine pyrophosphatase LpxH